MLLADDKRGDGRPQDGDYNPPIVLEFPIRTLPYLVLSLAVSLSAACSGGTEEQAVVGHSPSPAQSTPQEPPPSPPVPEASPQLEAEEEPRGERTPEPARGSGVQVEAVELVPLKTDSTDTTAPSRDRKRKRWLGLSVANMKEAIPGAPPEARTLIQRVHRGGPGYLAGLQRDDVILRAEGVPVLRYQDYIAQARTKEIGSSLHLSVLRDGRTLEVDLEMIEQPADLKAWRREHFPGTPAFTWDIPSVRPAGTRHRSTTRAEGHQLLYFWATWCSPCRRTSPLVERLHQDADGQVEVIAVSSEERDVVEAFLKKGGTSYPVGLDSEGTTKLDYEVKSLPTIVWVRGDEVQAWDYGIGGVRRVVDRLTQELDQIQRGASTPREQQ
ncbi:MAG: thioredoxin-like domain-containing protein [Myxococcota bacterium]|nr:thioredoxin-like domain-containing protein [Myxococcota bacterium]